jgi:hypothetical protein
VAVLDARDVQLVLTEREGRAEEELSLVVQPLERVVLRRDAAPVAVGPVVVAAGEDGATCASRDLSLPRFDPVARDANSVLPRDNRASPHLRRTVFRLAKLEAIAAAFTSP